MVFYIILCIIWGAISISMMIGMLPYLSNLELYEKFMVGIIILLSSPIMLLAQVIEEILNCFLEKGWNDDDKNKYGY